MLELRSDCESCNRDLPAEQTGALTYAFECTFCTTSNEECHRGTCSNWVGRLVPRPTWSTELLQKYPASTERKFRP